MTRLAVFLALCGALTLATGAALIYLPAGLIVAGLEALGAAYAFLYREARR